MRIGSSMVVAILALLFCASGAFASVMGDGDGSTLGVWAYDWGTIDAQADWEGTGAGTHLVWDIPSSVALSSSEDWAQQSNPVPSPGGVDAVTGEYWDVEILAFAQDAGSSGNYYFMAVLSTSQDLYNWYNQAWISVGDLAINPTTTTTDYMAGYGVKLAGTNQGYALQNARFGWGIDSATYDKDLRNPRYFKGDLTNTGGFYPGQPNPSYAEPYDWASNFVYTGTSGGVQEDVRWHRVLGSDVAGDLDADGPGNNGLDTWAVEVTIPKTRLGFLGTIHDFSIASTCLNDGQKSVGIGASPPVPQLPPTLLAIALPAIGLLFRRAKSR